MSNQVMFDLESWGQLPNSAIASIGAVVFNIEEGIIDRYYVNISPADCKKYKLDFDPSTLDWWSKRPVEVRQALTVNPKPLKEALVEFSEFVKKNKCTVSWAWGSSFDHSLMAYSCAQVGIKEPWKYYEQRCARTVGKLFNIEPKRDDSHHNALADAEAQANMILDFYAAING